MALLDILGKALSGARLSIARRDRRAIRRSARLPIRPPPDSMPSVSRLPTGIAANQGKAYHETNVLELIKQVPDDRDFVLSAHGWLDAPGDAARRSRRASRAATRFWIDEPCSVSNPGIGPQGLWRDGNATGVRARHYRSRAYSLALLREGLDRRSAAGYRPVRGLAARAAWRCIAEAYYVAIAPAP